MTKINNLTIKGFKGVQDLDVSLSNFTVITGRNNSGKTSLLESIDLLFNPHKISEYGNNTKYLINSERSAASISMKYQKSQSQISDFSSDTDKSSVREIGLRSPREDEIINSFETLLWDIVELNDEYPINQRFRNVEGLSEVGDVLKESFQEVISDISEEEVLNSSMADSLIMLEVSGHNYPFVYLDDTYDEFRNKLIKKTTRHFKENYLQEKTQDSHLDRRIEMSINSLLAPRFGRGRFVREEPEKVPGAKLIKPVSGNLNDFDRSGDDSAIRQSYVEKYLKEKEILDNLIDFSFDKLVFEGETEPYDVPYNFIGEGAKTVIRILWELFEVNSGQQILLLEEPENHMHPGYIENLTKDLVNISHDKNIQIIMTTHNTDFIQSFFSKGIEKGMEQYLENEFKLIQLTNKLHKEMGYYRAKEKIEDLNLDLRGI